MSRRTKHFLLMAMTQAGFLAVGLWMQCRYTTSSAVRAASDQAWSRMEAATRTVAADLDGIRFEYLELDSPSFERITGGAERRRSHDGEVTITDKQWRVVFSSPSKQGEVDGASEPPLVGGAVAPWAPNKDETPEESPLRRGSLALPGGDHMAIAHPLANDEGYLLLHRPKALVDSDIAAMLVSLPGISMVTFVWMLALMSIAGYMVIINFHEGLDAERSRSATGTLRQTQVLVRTRDAVIFGLAKLAESRDPDTGDHLERISVYSTTLAAVLRRHPKFSETVTPAFVRLIGISSALHDIGKVGVEDRILCKAGILTEEETLAMQKHTSIGGTCLRDIEQRLGRSNFLQMAREIAYAHHENWDGHGYPNGLSGTQIPLSARIVAIADVYDALSSRRVYKQAMSHDECVEIIRNEAGKKFDPDLVDVWMTIEPRFQAIAAQFRRRPGGTSLQMMVEEEDRSVDPQEDSRRVADEPMYVEM